MTKSQSPSSTSKALWNGILCQLWSPPFHPFSATQATQASPACFCLRVLHLSFHRYPQAPRSLCPGHHIGEVFPDNPIWILIFLPLQLGQDSLPYIPSHSFVFLQGTFHCLKHCLFGVLIVWLPPNLNLGLDECRDFVLSIIRSSSPHWCSVNLFWMNKFVQSSLLGRD